MASELVLLFKADSEKDILEQLSEALDKHSQAGKLDTIPSLVIVNQEIW